MIELRNIQIKRTNWRSNFNITIQKNDWLSIIGPSGGGKSTLLEAISGLYNVEHGTIFKYGIDITKYQPHCRNIAYVFQKNSLFNHLSILKNLELVFHNIKLSKFDINKYIMNTLDLLKLSPKYLSKYPSEVSGGELARFNIAKAILKPCDLLLLDEAFSTLDENLRLEMNLIVKNIHYEKSLTTISVTHHQEDAIKYSTKIAYINNGKILKYDYTLNFIQNPEYIEIAKFIRTGGVITDEISQKSYYLTKDNSFINYDKIPTNLKNSLKIFKLNNYTTFYDNFCLEVLDTNTKQLFKFYNEPCFDGIIYYIPNILL